MEQFLLSLGINLASNAIYDLLKSTTSKDELIDRIASQLSITDAKINAEKIIEFAAKNGDIIISGSSIAASNKITLNSNFGTKFCIKDNCVSQTSSTKIVVGKDASIIGTGGAKIVQNSDGSISFFS